MKALPIHYHIEVYENSFTNDPSWAAESITPFPTLSKGDGFNHSSLAEFGWSNPPNKNQEFRVKDIEHIFWQIENSHLGHKLMVSLELTARIE